MFNQAKWGSVLELIVVRKFWCNGARRWCIWRKKRGKRTLIHWSRVWTTNRFIFVFLTHSFPTRAISLTSLAVAALQAPAFPFAPSPTFGISMTDWCKCTLNYITHTLAKNVRSGATPAKPQSIRRGEGTDNNQNRNYQYQPRRWSLPPYRSSPKCKPLVAAHRHRFRYSDSSKNKQEKRM